MRISTIFCCLTLAALTATFAQADKLDAAKLSDQIAPLVDGQTLLIAHVDIQSIDTTAGLDKLTGAFQLLKDTFGRYSPDPAAIDRRLALLKQQGVQDLFVLVNVADVPSHPVMIVVPVVHDADPAKIAEALNTSSLIGGKVESARFDNNLVVAPPAAIERVRAKRLKQGLQKAERAPRPEIAEAFKAVENSAVQLLFVPSTETRRVAEEMLPALPQFVGGGAIKPFTSGLRWVAMGAALPPKQLSVTVIVQAADAQSATTLANESANVVKAIGNQKMVQEMIPKFNEVTRLLVPTVHGDRLSLEWTEANGGLQALVSLLGPPIHQMQDAASIARSTNNLKQLGLAMHNHHGADGKFPARVILSAEGKPLLSWRVAILPFLEQVEGNQLYKEFHLDEPWDSEHNRKLIDRMPAILRSPLSSAPADRTTYLAPIFPGGIFGGTEGLSVKQITDGLSNTILIVEGDDDHAVIWTKPDDLEINVDNPTKGLLLGAQKSLLALLADGFVRRFPKATGPKFEGKKFGAMFTAHGDDLFKLFDD